jgi:serine/threonine-protein kinase HipA
MTLLKKTDKEEASYVDLAEFIAVQGSPAHIAEDLKQLFTRVAFNIAVANRDDHLRNHGFMRTLAGWRLAKAYDMNPSVKKPEHVLGINEGQHGPSLETLLETAVYYNLDETQGLEIIENVLSIVATWRVRAKAMHIALADVEEMDHLFITGLA